jgi:Cytochrome c7 and related cytochrome c
VTRGSQIKIVLVAAFAVAVLVDISSRTVANVFPVEAAPPPSQAAPQQASPFSHSQHLKGGANCTDCHKPTAEGEVTLARPGHEACNTCHKQWFDAPATKREFCTVCHTNVTADQLPDLRSFPRYNKPSAILFDFSHKLHLGVRGKVTQVVGARLDCKLCHQFDAKGEKATFPAHRECGICHSIPDIKPKLAGDSKNGDCLGCHTSVEQENPNYRKLRRFIVDPNTASIARSVSAPSTSGDTLNGRDLKFSHSKHLTDDRNAGITCETCHNSIDQKTSLSQLNIPSMWDCTMCHESRRTTPAFRISNCSVCHTQIAAGRKPRNHTLTERPTDHTAAFRVRHAEAARSPDAKCAFCHEFVSSFRPVLQSLTRTGQRPLPNGNCDECHSVMRPKSHTIRWRNDLHGRMAAMDRVSCAVCHQADTCERCHNERPRSHNPINAFVNGGHRFLAQINQRSCFTCHEYTQTCERCHSVKLRD